MARNDNEGVLIPVTIDIEGAAENAASRVGSAMKPLQREISSQKLQIDLSGTIRSLVDDIEGMYKKISRLNKINPNVEWSSPDLPKYENALRVLLEVEQKLNKISTTNFEQHIQGLSRTNFELLQMREYYKQLERASLSMSDSINSYKQKIQDLNRQWNALTTAQKFDGSGNYTQEASAILEKYRQSTEFLQKQGQSLSQIIAQEQKRAKLVNQGVQNRRYEQFALNNVAKTMNGLRQQAQFLQAAMDRSVPNTAQWNIYKSQLDKVNEAIREITGSTAQQNTQINATKRAVDNTSESIKRQSSLWQQVKSYAGMYLSIFGGLRLLHNIRETTAQFELQRVALGAILNDTQKAESLFRRLKQAALESPFEIKDLVTYTKQLAAYQIETDKLFDTTKKLADISAGLGVDMGRLILAFGQVRAASVLRGQELRQFTEAGVPLVDKLAEKVSELRGEVVQTSEVFDLISKRQIPFEMISAIFDDMTERGGIFYDMQKKQSETLYGQYQKLKDAVSIMYDEMGNSSVMSSAFRVLLDLSLKLLRSWRQLGNAFMFAIGARAAFKALSATMLQLNTGTHLAHRAEILYTRAKQMSNNETAKASVIGRLQINMLRRQAIETRLAATATTTLSRSWHKFMASVASGGWIGLVVTAIGALVGYLVSANSEIRQLNKELEQTKAKATTNANASARNFERLAGIATDSSKSIVEQEEAIEELQRTYADILPSVKLQRGYLQGLNGDYKELTQSIKEYIYEESRRQQLESIQSTYGTKIGDIRKRVKRNFAGNLYGIELSPDEVEALMDVLQEKVDKGLYKQTMSIKEKTQAMKQIVEEFFGDIGDFSKALFPEWEKSGAYKKLVRVLDPLADVYASMNESIAETDNSMSLLIGSVGVYSKNIETLRTSLEGADDAIKLTEKWKDRVKEWGSFEFNQDVLKQRVSIIQETLKQLFANYEIDWDKIFAFDSIDFKPLEEKIQGLPPVVGNTLSLVKKEYEKLIPDDSITRTVNAKFISVAAEMGISIDKMRGSMKQGKDNMQTWIKQLKDTAEAYKESIKSMVQYKALWDSGVRVGLPISQEDIDAQQKQLEFLQKIIALFDEPEKKKPVGSKADNRLSDLRTEISQIIEAYKKLQELKKFKSQQDSLIDIDMLFPSLKGWEPTFDNMIDKLQKMLDKVSADARRNPKDKVLIDMQNLLEKEIANIKFDKLKTDMEIALKKLSEEVGRSEIARNFFDTIFKNTGDKELASSLAIGIYGSIGDDFTERIQKQLDEALKNVQVSDLGEGDMDIISKAIKEQDFKTLFNYIDKFPEEWQKALKEARDASEKYNADWFKDLTKSYQETKTYEERISAVRAEAEDKKNKVKSSPLLSTEQKEQYTQAIDEKATQEIIDIQVEAIKNTYEWTQAFEDMDKVTTNTLSNLIKMLKEYISLNASKMTPEQLKALTQGLEQAEAAFYNRRPEQAVRSGWSAFTQAHKDKKNAPKGSQEAEDATARSKEAIYKMNAGLAGMKKRFEDIAEAIGTVMEAFGVEEESAAGGFLQGMIEGYKQVVTMIEVCQIAMLILNAIVESNPIGAIVAAIATSIALFSAFLGMKAAKAEKKIKEQKKLVEQLERAYSSLEKQLDRTFGSDYIDTYKAQLQNLYATQASYEKMVRLEKSKGKKTDDAKVKEYQDKVYEIGEQIKEMQTQLSEFFTNTDVSSAAEDFASAWLEAYKAFDSTTEAMREKFNEMIENMVTRSLGAKIMQTILQPLFDEIDNMAADGDLNANEISRIAVEAPGKIRTINDAMTIMINELANAGLNVRRSMSGLSGISKDIAGASEESILGLAAGINTQNFYISYVPKIDEKVAQIVQMMQNGSSLANGAVTTSNTENNLTLQYLSYIPQMSSDVNEILINLRRVISPKGTNSATHYIAIN